MRKLLLAVCLALLLMMTGCASSTNPSPILIDQCRAIATQAVRGPDDSVMEPPTTPVKYTEVQISKGVSRSEVVTNQTTNNGLWEEDRNKLISLQGYVKTLQENGIVSK